jgi:hypothetical protein
MQDPNLSSNTPGTALMQVQKLPTGMEGFDDILHGGLPIGRSTAKRRLKPETTRPILFEK